SRALLPIPRRAADDGADHRVGNGCSGRDACHHLPAESVRLRYRRQPGTTVGPRARRSIPRQYRSRGDLVARARAALEPAGARVTGVTGTDIIGAVRALQPEILSRGDEIASRRRLPLDLVDRLKTAGAFRIAMPKVWG